MVEIWVVKYKDGKMVGNKWIEVSTLADAKQFRSEMEALSVAAFLNKGLHEKHLGRVIIERLS